MTTKTAEPSSKDIALVVPAAEQIHGVMGFSLRPDGGAETPKNSLDFAVSNGNSEEHLSRNLDALSARLGIDATQIVTAHQTHGDHVAIVDSVPERIPDADAIISKTPGIFPAVKTADCLSVLVLAEGTTIAAAIHAGWRGTVKRITRKVILTLLTNLGCEARNLVVSLGPVIGPCCYEVDAAVLVPFRKAIPEPDRFITVHGEARSTKHERGLSHRLDLAAVNRFELVSLGIPDENIHDMALCTSCNPQLFFSFRRDGMLAGRHIAVTGFKT